MFNFICTVTLYLVVGWVMWLGYRREKDFIVEVLDSLPVLFTWAYWKVFFRGFRDAWVFGLRQSWLNFGGLLGCVLLPLIVFTYGIVQVVVYIINLVKRIKQKLQNFTFRGQKLHVLEEMKAQGDKGVK